ncbi:hypothetical protein KA005_69020 [bacterium]|nr:hypothetical protein [bacterium]
MTLEERIKEMAFEDGCGSYLDDSEKSLEEQYYLLKKAIAPGGRHGMPDGVEPCHIVENIGIYELLEVIDAEVSYNEKRYMQIAKLARMPQDVEQGKETLEWLEEHGIKLLSLDRLRENLIGETIECDVLLQSLQWAGCKAVYENIISNSAGFFALIYADGKIIGAVDNFSGEHIVRAWKPELLKPIPLVIEKV